MIDWISRQERGKSAGVARRSEEERKGKKVWEPRVLGNQEGEL